MLDPSVDGIGVYDSARRYVEWYVDGLANLKHYLRVKQPADPNRSMNIKTLAGDLAHRVKTLLEALSEVGITGGVKSSWFRQYALKRAGEMLSSYEERTRDKKHEQLYPQKLELLIEEWCGGPVTVSQ